MDTARRIGLLPGFRWIAGRGFLRTFFICLLITPIGHCVVGLVFESRWVPLASSRQFLSFFPGDIVLALMAAGLLTLARELPERWRLYNSPQFHRAILVATVLIGLLMTYNEWQSGFYPFWAIFSPTKFYHNLLLYGGYGYVIIVTLTAILKDGRSWRVILVILPGVVWAALVVLDNTLLGELATEKAAYAHVANWRPIWETWSIRFVGF